MPADSSQLNAVAEAVAGRTFVLEGPPGTGKSQTITNLLAHAMSSGLRVLFVAEKRAALDVVKKRLEAVGLGELSLDLHDKSARPTAVRQQIKEALELRVSHDQGALRTNSQAAESSRARSPVTPSASMTSMRPVFRCIRLARRNWPPTKRSTHSRCLPNLSRTGPRTPSTSLDGCFATLPEKVDLARPSDGHPWGFIDVRQSR